MSVAQLQRPIETFRVEMARAGKEVRQDGRAQCPGHNGDGFNLAFNEGDDGTLLLYCHSHECTPDKICEGLNISVRDLFPNGTLDRNIRTKAKIAEKTATIHATSDAAIEALRGVCDRMGECPILTDLLTSGTTTMQTATALVGSSVGTRKTVRRFARFAGTAWVGSAKRWSPRVYCIG